MQIFASIILKSSFLSKAPIEVYQILGKYPSSAMGSTLEKEKAKELVYEVEEHEFNEIVEALLKKSVSFMTVIHSKDGKADKSKCYGLSGEEHKMDKNEKIIGSIKKKDIKKLLDEADADGLTTEALNKLYMKLLKLI